MIATRTTFAWYNWYNSYTAQCTSMLALRWGMSVSDPTADICDAGNINRGVAWWLSRGIIEITQEISFYQHPTQVKELDVDGACLIKVAHNY